MPKHKNIIKNFVNIELFHKNDLKQEDCIGWITIMEKAEEDLRTVLKEENGEWQIPAELKNKIISEGGEALVFSEKFGIFETAVRIQIFDSFLFTDDFGLDLLTWKINFEKGKIFLYISEITSLRL